jgi:hypothetical protein
VQVLSRWAGNTLVNNTVTDPYSLSLNANSQRSFVANLDSNALKPNGWEGHPPPKLAHPADISLYELHIRDFSISDNTVPAAHRGKYLAFTDAQSNGMRHLGDMQKAGLSHIHLLPAFDIASVNETGCSTPSIPNAARQQHRAASGGGSRARQRLLQLGLRPGPLHGAGRQLLVQPQRRRGARASSAPWCRAAPARLAGGDGRGLQPHQRLAARRAVGAR